MIDLSKYTLNEQQAINDVLYDLQRYLWDNEMEWAYLHDAFFYSTMELRKAIDHHAHDHAAAEAEKVDRIKQACIAGAPPAEEPAEKRDLQSLVDDLYRCSARLAALADGEDEHFAECSRTEVFDKVMLLRGGERAVGELAATIRDHYDGLH